VAGTATAAAAPRRGARWVGIVLTSKVQSELLDCENYGVGEMNLWPGS
jgi:hypothetical protein